MAIATDEIEQIYRRTLPRATGLAVTLLHDEEEARDVVQEVFAQLVESAAIPRHRRVDNPDAFIFRSVRNACVNRVAMMETRERIRRQLPLDTVTMEDLTEERIKAVQQAAEKLLSKREGEVVREIFSDGHSYKEAAQELGVSVAAVNKYLVNALRKLRKHFNTRQS